MTDNNLLTVAEIGQYAPEIDTSRFDAPTLSGIITQASKDVSDYLEYTPLAEDIANELKTAMITPEGDLLIFPQKLPLQSVSAIAITKGATSVTLNLTDGNGNEKFNIDYTKRHIRYPYDEISIQGTPIFTNFFSLRGTQFYVKISYRAGWEPSELPGTIKQAAILFMKDILANQYNQMGASRIRQGAIEFDFRTGGSNGIADSKFVRDAKRLLNPYRRIG